MKHFWVVLLVLALLFSFSLAQAASTVPEDLKAGDIITMGHYPQTASGKDSTPIEWIVLETDGHTALVISRYGLDVRRSDTLWSASGMRKWLNGGFYDPSNSFIYQAFNEDELGLILARECVTDDVDWTAIAAEDGYTPAKQDDRITDLATQDLIFLLSAEEVAKYLPDSASRVCRPTAYTIKKSSGKMSAYSAPWWLRSAGTKTSRGAVVDEEGKRQGSRTVTDTNVCVRPAMRIMLSDSEEAWADLSLIGEENGEGVYLGEVKVGQNITFGHYPQTDSGRDRTAIEWMVLEVSDGSALLLSKYGLDRQPYNTARERVTWETCSLRQWLNATFVNKAFSSEELRAVMVTDVVNEDVVWLPVTKADGKPLYDPDHDISCGITRDRVFLLSVQEVGRLMPDLQSRRMIPSAYAIAQGAWYKRYTGHRTFGDWWLRSGGTTGLRAGDVYYNGVRRDHEVTYEAICVRPAIRIRLPQSQTQTD